MVQRMSSVQKSEESLSERACTSGRIERRIEHWHACMNLEVVTYNLLHYITEKMKEQNFISTLSY